MQKNESDRIAEILLKQFKRQLLSTEEQELLDNWLSGSATNRAAYERIQDESNIGKYLSVLMDSDHTDDAFQQFKAAIAKDEVAPEHPEKSTGGRSVHLLTTTWVRYAAAVTIILSVATWFLVNKGSRQPVPMQVQGPSTNVDPGKNGAILTLADGSQMVLDSLGNGVVASQSGARVVLNNGALNYNSEHKSKEFAYNTMSTPKGRQFELVLSDGTHVWLNAASSIRYPTAFTGAERVVVIKGEAYFEVKHDDAHPFRVIAGNQVIRDLGTSFNVKAYSDEPQIKTTLVEGIIQIGQTVLNKPGQQLNGTRLVTADIALETAWKNGAFDFDGLSFREAMRQLERWYDIDIIYENDVPDDIPFTGRINRQTSLQSLLKLLETTSMKFRMEDGRKLIIRKS